MQADVTNGDSGDLEILTDAIYFEEVSNGKDWTKLYGHTDYYDDYDDDVKCDDPDCEICYGEDD
jgi:hypothetical protein